MSKMQFLAVVGAHVLLTATPTAASAAVIQVEVVNPTTIIVRLSGTISGPPTDASGVLFIDTLVSSATQSGSISIVGNVMLGPQQLISVYSGFDNPPYGGTLQLRDSLNGEIPFVVGDVLSGTATVTFDSDHGLTQAMFDGIGVPIYWGRDVSSSPGYGAFQGYAVTPLDTDTDGVLDTSDNCTEVPNASQCDSDGDNYGNHCDGDLNNNTFTNAQDYINFRAQLDEPSVAPTYNQADLNCNGFVNGQDYILFRQRLGLPSGPSGLVP